MPHKDFKVTIDTKGHLTIHAQPISEWVTTALYKTELITIYNRAHAEFSSGDLFLAGRRPLPQSCSFHYNYARGIHKALHEFMSTFGTVETTTIPKNYSGAEGIIMMSVKVPLGKYLTPDGATYEVA